MRTLAVIPFLLVGSLLAAPVPKSLKVKRDDEAVVGVWKVVAVDGLPPRLFSAKDVAETRFHFLEDGMFVFDTPTDWSYGCKFKLDPNADKKRFDLDRGDVTFGGLYELSGDNLTLCWNLKSCQTPSELKADDTGVCVWTLERVKGEKNLFDEDQSRPPSGACGGGR